MLKSEMAFKILSLQICSFHPLDFVVATLQDVDKLANDESDKVRCRGK